MKKITFKILMALMFISIGYSGTSQTLNQPANWPNAGWTLTGTFTPGGLLSDPTVAGTTFTWDDDAAGNGSADDLQAMSPVIDLTAASNAGETWVTVSGEYTYRPLGGDILSIEVYDADAMTWSALETFVGNSTVNDFQTCANTEAYTTAPLDISGFTATQLSGFQYRVSYDDLGGWQWGWCLTSPTITSAPPPTCFAPSNLTGMPVTSTSADLSWDAGDMEMLWDIEIVDVTGGESQTMTPTATGVGNPYTAMGLTEGNDYEFYVRADCGGDVSTWSGPFSWNQVVPPVNDVPGGAIPIVPAAEGDGCTNTFLLPFSTDATTDSGTDPSCAGDPGLDQFFTWTATSDGLLWNDLAPGNPGIAIWDANTLTEIDCSDTFATADLVLSGWTIGQDLVIQIFDFGGSLSDVAFCLEEYALPMAPECALNPIPADDAIDVDVFDVDNRVTLTWEYSMTGETADSFDILFGTASGALNNLGNFTGTTIDITGLDFSTEYFWTIVPNNGASGATGCPEWSFTTEAAPACPDPSALDATNITPTTADLSWTENGTTMTWNIELVDVTAGGTQTMTATDTGVANPYMLTGLAVANSYEYYVQADCGVDGLSAWVGPFAFTTASLPPVNDDICNAIALTLDVTPAGDAYTSVGSTSEVGEVEGSCFNGGLNGSTWYTFVAPASGEVEVSTDIVGGTHTDTEIAVYEAPTDCADASTMGAEVGCDQDGGTDVNFNSVLPLTGLTPGNTYYVQVDRWGSADDGTYGIQVFDQVTLGVGELENDSAFTYYPNPVKNTLTLNAQNNIESVTMYNMLGQEVLKAKPNSLDSELDMSSLDSGAYFVQVTIANITETIRVVKQ